MVKCGLFLLLLAAQSFLSSGAFVRSSLAEANLRRQTKPVSNTLSFSHSIWNNTIANLAQKDIEMVRSKPPKVNKIYYVILTMLFGTCGCDRCFMGQICLGVVKGCTLGGFVIWQIIDYIVCFVNALSEEKDIHVVGVHATFTEDSIELAKYVAIGIFIYHLFDSINRANYAKRQAALQQEQQETLARLMAENGQPWPPQGNGSDGQPAQEEDCDIPMRHQSLAYIPTALTRGLRVAGIVTEKPTVPELIAAFDQIDKDGDGQLDHEEIKEAMAAMGINDDTVDAMIKAADTDGDGKISKNEFLISMTSK